VVWLDGDTCLHRHCVFVYMPTAYMPLLMAVFTDVTTMTLLNLTNDAKCHYVLTNDAQVNDCIGIILEVCVKKC